VSVELKNEIKVLSELLAGVEKVLQPATLQEQITRLEGLASAPNLWDDPANAQKVNSQLSYLKDELAEVTRLRQNINDAEVLLDLATSEKDLDSVKDVAAELKKLSKEISELEVKTLLSGEYDLREALVTIRSEAGGVDAADWAEMLLRMYLRFCERKNWKTQIYETSYAEEAGIKSVTFAVQAPYAYGNLSIEQGTHRLVRISPFDSQSRRHTSFAAVEVVPVVSEKEELTINEDELRIDVYRSSGPGGQGVNTTDSAVRITHIPSGIVVACQNERSQLQNKATAMAILQAKLLDRKRQAEQEKINALKDTSAGSWGNQMRSYVLHPYQLVKDLRTNYETGNTQAVLDGDLDEFIASGIRWRKTRN
jgi:peptide chain release factor 2